MRKIVITGANGFLGKYLSQWFLTHGWRVVGLSRNGQAIDGVEAVPWDGRTMDLWAARLDGADVLINLAGKSVNCRYGARNKATIFQSRLESTAVLGAAIRACVDPPRLWLNSSTATIYRHAEDGPQDERTGELGEGFSVEVAMAWEKVLRESEVPAGVTKVAIRPAIVLANEPGTVFDYLRKIAKLGLGGRMGSGRQKMSWIHIEDFCRSLAWLIAQKEQAAVYNIAAPEATDNSRCMKGFRRIAGRGFGLPAMRWMLEIGTFIMRTESELVLKSRWVVPGNLEREGFDFRWSDFDGALDDLEARPGLDALAALPKHPEEA